MKKSLLLLASGTAAGFLLGLLVSGAVIAKLKSENEQLRAAAGQVDSLKAENARLTSEQIDSHDLKRLRDSQAELLRLRGQVNQLRQESQEAKAAAIASARKTSASVSTNIPAPESPVNTFTANVKATLSWREMLVTGGWQSESGKRVFAFLLPEETENNGLRIKSYVAEMPEELVAKFGLDKLNSAEAATTKSGLLSPDQARDLLHAMKEFPGVDILNAPQLETASGRQAQIAATQEFTNPSGQTYQTGPVLDVVPTVQADGKSVELIVSAQLNLAKDQTPALASPR
jgi:hypothetical protein